MSAQKYTLEQAKAAFARHGTVAGAARELGVSRITLLERLRKHGVVQGALPRYRPEPSSDRRVKRRPRDPYMGRLLQLPDSASKTFVYGGSGDEQQPQTVA